MVALLARPSPRVPTVSHPTGGLRRDGPRESVPGAAMSDFSLEPTGVSPTPPAPGLRPWRVVTVVLALAVAALTFLLLREHGVIGPDRDESPARMGGLACELVTDFDLELALASEDAEASLARLGAARSLATLAASQDPAYADLDQALNPMSGPDEVTLSLMADDAREACARL